MAPTDPVWHSIRPWTPPLELTVREITSVSATFILSSTLNGDLDPSLASLAEDDTDPDHTEGNDAAGCSKRQSIISDALAKGLSVNVNGSPWQRVFIRIEDKVDEAVIIIYGLMPGRQYDVDLALVQNGHNNSLRRQVITEDLDLEPSEPHTDPDSPSLDHSTSSDPAISTPSTSPSRTAPNINTPPPPLTFEERLAQLQHALTVINAERETVLASLKSARRDAQKADAALRSEIDILKRASEKHAAAEHRAKQKILALQEALKRAQTATQETEEQVKEVESVVPDLNEKKAVKEEVYVKIKEQADRARKERDQEKEKEKKKLDLMKGELAGLAHKMERLNGKKDKLEMGVIPDLEEQLKEIEREIERAEADSFGGYQQDDDLGDIVLDHQQFGYPLTPRIRQQVPGTISRPSPIQRPSPGGTQPQLWSTSPRQLQPHTQTQRSSPLHHHPLLPSSISSNPQRRSSLKSVAPTTPSTSSTSSSPTTANATATASSTAMSTLSSLAPAFEPGRPLKNTPSTISHNNSPGVLIQRPGLGPGTRGVLKVSSLVHGNNPQWAGMHGGVYDGGRGG